MNFWLKLWKDSEEYGFLKQADSQAIQQSQKQLDRAFSDAFDKNQPLKRIPVFKRKGGKDSFTYRSGSSWIKPNLRFVAQNRLGQNIKQPIGDRQDEKLHRLSPWPALVCVDSG